MKFRNYSFMFVFVTFVVLLFFCSSKNEASQNVQADTNIIENIVVDEGVEKPEIKKKKLAEKIEQDYENLSCYFKESKFMDMANVLGESAIIVSPEGEIIQGKEDIAQFWSDMKNKAEKEPKKEEYVELKIKIKRAFITDIEKIKVKDKIYDSVAFETFKFHLIRKKEGEKLQNISGRGDRRSRHREDCEWF